MPSRAFGDTGSERSYELGSSRLNIVFGDILGADAEVLVSSDDFMLSMGGGVSRAIGSAAGSSLWLDIAKSVPRQLGDVVVTTAGALDARYIFHVVTIGPIAEQEPPELTPRQMVREATRKCLELMGPLGARSIAFPALGTGVARYPVEDAAAAMTEVISDFLTKSAEALTVSLRLFARPGMNERNFIVFYEELARRVPIAGLQTSVPDPGSQETATSAALSELLTLERERQRLEQEIVLMRSAADAGQVEELNKELRSNLDRRLDVAVTEQQERSASAVRIFVSYAHEDRAHCVELQKHLSNLRAQGIIETWTDQMITPGANWDTEINQSLAEADIVLFLISADFMASEYINSVEVAKALERHHLGEARLIPVMVRYTVWDGSPLSSLQALPTDLIAIEEWASRDRAYGDVVRGIQRAIAELRPAKQR